MNEALWNSILEYNLDSPISEYGFSSRLAYENYWTKNFTQKAILEYKKFMYLAGTSDLMVSPSEIVDIVWHQHLIFTQSYKEFCDLLGKQIQHVPSTHNRADYEKFKQAKERTKKLYTNIFNKQPIDIWGYSGMYESLELDKANLNIRTFILFGILAFTSLLIPFYFLLKPIYIKIDNPDFSFGFMGLAFSIFVSLELYNRHYLSTMVRQVKPSSFLFDLQPLEVLYLKTQKLSDVVNGTLNQLIIDKKVIVNNDYTLHRAKECQPITMEEYQTLDLLDKSGKIHYPALLKQLMDKPIFWNTANCMDAFKKYFNKSKKFGALFYLNFVALSILLMLGVIRYSTGVLRDRPIDQISTGLIILAIIIIAYLNRLTKLACTETIPDIYKYLILPASKDSSDWQWQYFLLGTSALAPSFVPIVNYIDKHDVGSGGGSCGSSCGSSCSSCGGCGGD